MTRSQPTRSGGFTIIEVLIALTVLLVGLVSTLALVSAANGRSTATKGREGATNLAREVSEQVRSLNYSELTGALMVSRLQARPQLADASTAPGWQINRRGFVFTVVPSICAVDDRADKYGSHAGGGFCADSFQEGIDDATPEDLKRVVMEVSFVDRGKTITSRSTTTMNSTGQTNGLPVLTLGLHATNPATVIGPSASEPVIGSSVSQLTFRVTTSEKAAAVQWNVEGRRKVPDATRVDATTWEFSWPIGGLSDGTYGISAVAVNAKGELGPAREIPVRLARNIPGAPTGLVGGYNTVFDAGVSRSAAELEWTAISERNIEGYRVYRGNGTLACPADPTAISTATSCVDLAPPADTATATARTYKVVGLYRNAADVLMETAAATKQVDPVSVTTANPPTTANTDHAFKLQNSTGNSGTSCPTTNPRDLRDGLFGGATSQIGATNLQLNFCTPAYPLAANQTSQLPAQTATVRLDLRTVINSQGWCRLHGNLRRAGTTTDIATANWYFDRTSNNGYFLRNLVVPAAVALAPNDKLTLNVLWEGPDCGKLTLNYGGTTVPGELNLRRSVTTTTSTTVTTRPNPPSNLTAATEPDGTVKLTWTKPAGGPPVDFYRIYRSSTNHTDRLTTAAVDTTAGVTTDSEFVNGGGATYWVTAVAPTLTESTFSNSVTVAP